MWKLNLKNKILKSNFNFTKLGLFVLLFAFVFLGNNQTVSAEGSKELVSFGGDRPYLDFTDAILGGLKRRTLVKVYVKNGETLNLGSSSNGLGSARIIATDPSGLKYTSSGAQGFGVMNNNIEEQAGPLPAVGGYKPFAITSTSTDGVWTIEFRGPVTTNTASGNNYAANAAWTRTNNGMQPTDQAQTIAWDATVFDKNGKIVNGRAYTNALSGTMRGNSRKWSSILYILTKEGWLYNFDANDMDPFGFIFLSNNRGNQLSNGDPSYQSRPDATASVHDPEAPDTTTFTHKIFFNTPDPNVFKTAPPPPELNNFKFVGREGTEGATGYGMGGYFVFDTNQSGRYKIKIDANNNNSTSDLEDIAISGDVTTGNNSIFWNGKDGNGKFIPPGKINAKAVTLEGVFAEVHFPLYDAEANPSGFIIKRLNGVNSPDDVIYFDDSLFPDKTSFLDSANSSTTGLHSTSGSHKWVGTNSSGKGGDTRMIDTWGAIRTSPIQINAPIEIRTASLYIKRTYFTPSTLFVGDNVTFFTDVVNDGPNDLYEATFFNKYPEGLYEVNSVPCSSTMGSICSDAFSISNGVLTGLFDIKKGETVTIGVSGKFTAPTTGNGITDISGVLRAPDYYDPQATAVAPPPNFSRSLDFLINQCIASGYLSSVCDNIATLYIAQVGQPKTPTPNPYPLPKPTATTTISTTTIPVYDPTPKPPEPIKKPIPTVNKNPEPPKPISTTTIATTTLPVIIKKPPVVTSSTTTDFTSKPLFCSPYLNNPISPKSSPAEINKVKNLLNLVVQDDLYLDGKYDDALVQSVKDFQTKNLHRITILTAGGYSTSTGMVDNYTMAQMNVDYCLVKESKNRCPYFFDYLTQGDKNGTKNKLQESTTTQVDVWKEFLNLLFPNANLKYNGIYDREMRNYVGKYQSMYRRTILTPWKYENPRSVVTFYLREASRNWANFMVNCPEGPIELYDGSGNVDYR